MIKELIQSKIFELADHRVMFDFDLSELYNVETRALKQAVRRNIQRFPKDFLIELSMKEWKELITICDNLPETAKFSPVPPFAFIRKYALNHQDLTERLEELEKRYDKKFQDINDAINFLLKKDQKVAKHQARKRIGFNRDDSGE